MTKNDKLYKETIIRLGKDQMAGVDSLLEKGHTGIAEKHTVLKLTSYVRELETKLGIQIPETGTIPTSGKIKVVEGPTVYYL